MKKKLAILLSLLIMISVFAACDSEREDDDDDDDTGTSLFDKYGKEDGKDEDDKVDQDEIDGEKRCEHEIDEYDWYTESVATCSEEGLRKATCSLCGEEVEETIEKIPHDPDEGEVRADGYIYICCNFCGEEIEKKEAPRHYESEYRVDEAGYYQTSVDINYDDYDVIKNNKNAIIYMFENGEELVTYANGYFISKKDDVLYLKTVDGQEITNNVSLGVNGFGMNDIEKYLADGYILAYKLDETFSGVTYQIGILKVDGTWLVPLAADNPLLTCGVNVTEDFIKNKIGYAGEGHSIIEVSSDIAAARRLLYSFNNKQTIIYDTNSIGAWDLSYMLDDFDFSNGLIRTFYNGNMREIKSDGTSTNTYIFPEGVSKYTDDANQYYISSDGTIYFIAKNANGIVLANSKGAIVKDFKEAYGADVTSAYHYGDGKWVLYLKNKEGTTYYTTIDITGTFKFDPIKYDTQATSSIRIMQDMIPNTYNDGVMIIDFETGAEIYKMEEKTWYDYFGYKNGIFFDDTAEEKYFVFEE